MGLSLLALLFAGQPHQIMVRYLGVLAWLPLRAVAAWIVLTGRLKPEVVHP
jgi:hypothetical protein